MVSSPYVDDVVVADTVADTVQVKAHQNLPPPSSNAQQAL